MHKILIICANGMSSSFLSMKIQEEAKNRNKGLIVDSMSSWEANRAFIEDYDVILFGPHVKFLIEKFKDNMEQSDISYFVLDIDLYGSMDAEKVYLKAINLIEGKKQNIPKRRIKIMSTFEKAMSGIVDNVEEKVSPIARKVGNNRYLQSIGNAFISTTTINVVGSLFILLGNLPLPAVTTWLEANGLSQVLSIPGQVTIEILALYISFLVAYYLAESFSVKGIEPGIISLIGFMMVIGRNEEGAIPVQYLGAQGLFTAMIVGLVAARLYVWIVNKGWTIKLPESVPPNVGNAFTALVPGFLIVTFFLIITGVMSLTQWGSFPVMVYDVLQANLSRFTGQSLFAWLFFETLTLILWLVGIHGGAVVSSITSPIYKPLSIENLSAYNTGQPLPHIISENFTYFLMGGAGSTLALALLMLFFAKSKRYKTLGKLGVTTGLFGINEPILFGLPIIMNPIFAIPFVLSAPLLGTLSYFLTRIGILPIPIGAQIPWTTPPLISGFFQGGGGFDGLKIAAWQFICILIMTVIYYPFFKVGDRNEVREEEGLANEKDLKTTKDISIEQNLGVEKS